MQDLFDRLVDRKGRGVEPQADVRRLGFERRTKFRHVPFAVPDLVTLLLALSDDVRSGSEDHDVERRDRGQRMERIA